MPAKAWLLAAAAAIALPAIAQQAVPQQPGPQTVPAEPSTITADPAVNQLRATPRTPASQEQGGDTGVEEVTGIELPPPPPPIEYPTHARRDPWVVGPLEPGRAGLGAAPWGSASGAFLSTLMRRMETPLASRWAHIALRNALLAGARAPRNQHPVDWVAERAWLLLRMGEADAARMLVAAVDTDRFTPKMTQVAVQSALASADPPALCPIEDRIRRHDPQISNLVHAMCSSLAGEPESAAAQIDDARRRGRIGGIDLTLAEKVVGAGADTGRAVTIEWEPVETLTAWRFGLATATGMILPNRLLEAASPRLRAFHGRAPLLTPQQRLNSAIIGAGLGVFSSQSLVDLYAAIYDSTDAAELAETDAFQLRQAFVGKDRDARLESIRRLLAKGDGPLEREAMRALAARAATLIDPDPEIEGDAPALISAMLAAGYDRQAARWANAVRQMGDENGDRAWAMLVLASPDTSGLDLSYGRITSFIGRDQSPGKIRSALLVGGLAGLGRINDRAADALNRRYGLGLGRQTGWTRMIGAAAARRQAGTVLVLTGTGFQTPRFEQLPGSHMYHAIAGLRATGQEFTARMIAGEALSRT